MDDPRGLLLDRLDRGGAHGRPGRPPRRSRSHPPRRSSAGRRRAHISRRDQARVMPESVPVHGFETPICAYAAMGIGAS